MSILVEDIRVVNEFNTGDTRHLVGCIGWKVEIETDVLVQTYFKAFTDNEIYLNDPAEIPNNIIRSESFGGFEDFNIGDSILIRGATEDVANNGYTGIIIAKTDGTLIMDTDLPGAKSSTPDATVEIIVTTIYDSLKFKYGLVENSETINFDSQVNNITQSYISQTITPAYLPMIGENGTTWQNGKVEVKEVGALGPDGDQRYTIKHTFFINPFQLVGDLVDYLSGVAPDYFINDFCLKYVTNIELTPTAANPNQKQIIETYSDLGDTGWLNEELNGKPTPYSIESITYTRVSDSKVLDSVQLDETEETEFTIVFKNDGTAPFTDGSVGNISINHWYLPTDQDGLIGNDNTMLENYTFDRALALIDSSPATVASYQSLEGNPDWVVLDEVTATYIDSETINIVGKVDFGAEAFQLLAAQIGTPYYTLSVSYSDYNLAAGVSDGVTIEAQTTQYTIDLGIDGLITFDTKFLEHPFTDLADATVSPSILSEDEVVMYSQIEVDQTLLETDMQIVSFEFFLQAYSPTKGSFIIDSYTQDVQGSSLFDGIEFFDIEITKAFKAPTTDQIKTIKLKRRLDLDANPKFYYDLYFPFLVRWEYWIEKTNVNGDFIDTLEQFNGQNEEWERFDDIGDWEFRAGINMNVQVDDGSQELIFTDQRTIPVGGYDESSEWDNETITTYNDFTGDPLAFGPNCYILGYEDTKVIASFEFVGGDPPTDETEVAWIFRLEQKETGGQFQSTRLSSERVKGADSQFKSVIAIKNAPTGNVFTAEAVIDHTKLQPFTQYCITARVYDLRDPAVLGKLKEDGDNKFKEDGDNKVKDP